MIETSRFQVRRLAESDREDILALMKGNPLFFQHCPPAPSMESIAEDMKALPPGMTYEDKYYLGFFDGGKLAVVLDLILNYPNRETAFIGFFMLDAAYQGRGTGSAVVEEMADWLKENGYRFMRLGYVKTNPQSRAFWLKNQFHETGIETKLEQYTLITLQRELPE